VVKRVIVIEGVVSMNKVQNKKNTWVGVCDFLKDQIISGALSPGEKINEREIADQVHVSRTPVREALRNLEYEGYILPSTWISTCFSPDYQEAPNFST
jgi:DNA-binding GntR family transcriptional regulator